MSVRCHCGFFEHEPSQHDDCIDFEILRANPLNYRSLEALARIEAELKRLRGSA